MIEVGAFEAKTHFSQLLAGVAKGETVAITKHGQRVALLVPAKPEEKDPVLEAMETMKKLRKGVTLGKRLTIKQLRDEGRR